MLPFPKNMQTEQITVTVISIWVGVRVPNLVVMSGTPEILNPLLL